MPRAGLVLHLLLLSACGPASGPAPGGRLLHLALAPAPDARELPSTRVVQRLQVSADVAPWRVVGSEASVAESAEGGRVLDVSGPALIEIPGPLEPGSFQQLAVVGTFPAQHQLEVRLVLESGQSEAVRRTVRAAGQERSLLIDLPGLRHEPSPVDRVQLAVRGPAFRLRAVDLREVPIARSLPTPQQAGLIEIADVARRGVGLVAGSPLQATFTPRAGEHLELACGVPEAARGEAGSVVLGLTLTSGAVERTREVALERDLETPSAWHELSVPLDGLAGREVLARFELRSDRPGPAACALADVAVVGPESDPPTVLLITSDTHRADYLAVSRSGIDVATPTLDALAARGVLFEDCFSSANNTSPSHVAILTGVTPRDTRMVDNHEHISQAMHTLAEVLHEHGWETFAAVSVRHLGPHGTGLGQGFDRMAGPALEPWEAEKTVDHLLSWLPAAADRPLFVWVHVFDAHTPYAPPAPFDRAYDPGGEDPFDPALGGEGLGPDEAPEELVGLRDLSWPETQYRGEVSYLDSQLARLVAEPRFATGVIAFTGDHGELFNKKGVHFTHAGLYPETLHVPLILAWPGGPRGERIARPVGNVDLGRTLLDLVGLRGADFPGTDLLARTDGPGTSDGPRFALSANGRAAMVAWHQWFLCLFLRTSAAPNTEHHEPHSLELYDRSSDPECLTDVAAAHREIARDLRRRLVAWLAAAPAEDLSVSAQLSTDALDALAALGYATGGGEPAGEEWIDPDCTCAQCRAWR